jgi:hypothetical protein
VVKLLLEKGADVNAAGARQNQVDWRDTDVRVQIVDLGHQYTGHRGTDVRRSSSCCSRKVQM